MTRIVDPQEREVEVLQRLVTFDGMDVLDIGCGEGRTAQRIARSAASVVGIDPDAERIAVARAAAAEGGSCTIEYRTDDVVTLELPSDGFDAVIFTRSL